MSISHSISLQPGTILQSPRRSYRVVRVLGQGGFGITYLVECEIHDGNIPILARFAIKEHFISQSCVRDSDTQGVVYPQAAAETFGSSLQAFVKEATRLQSLRLSHPNIININEVFEANGTAYYVMQYLDGESLAEYVRRRGPLLPDETDYFMRPLVEAVAKLHRNHLTHYDIKPDNIILSRGADGIVRAVLIDFGLSRHYDKSGRATSMISSAGFSPGYAPIEQYSGIKEFSPQSDVYSLAAVIYFCLTGNDPAEAFALDHDELEAELGAMAGGRTAGIIRRAMALKQNERQGDAQMLYDELYGGESEQAPKQAPVKTQMMTPDTTWAGARETVSRKTVAREAAAPEVYPQPTCQAQTAAPAKSRPGKTRIWAIAAGLVALIGIVTLVAYLSGDGQEPAATAAVAHKDGAYGVDDIPNVQLIDSRCYVSDPDNLLPDESRMRLDSIASALKSSDDIETGVVIVKSINGDIDTFATELFNSWGIGDTEKKNGLLILVATEDRKAVIRLGYRLNIAVSDADCERILGDGMTPEFASGRYAAGIEKGLLAVRDKAKQYLI